MDLEELKKEASAAGLVFSPNIGAVKLKEKLDEHYKTIDTDKVPSSDTSTENTPEDEEKNRISVLQIIKAQENAVKKTAVVKVTLVDKREASTATHAYFSSGLVALTIPLDVFVEMPIILINQAENAKALIHVESKGKTEYKLQKKYVVEYMRQ